MTENTSTYESLSNNYHQIERAIAYLEENYKDQPGLKDIAGSIGYSEFHFQRLFKRWVGISPKRFLQFLTKEHAKQLLDQSSNILDVSYQTGLSGPGRLHDLFVNTEAVTPGEFKRKGYGLTIYYGFFPSQFGECLIALTDRGISNIAFVNAGDRVGAKMDLKARMPEVKLVEDQKRVRPYLDQIFPLSDELSANPIPLFLRGSNFQLKVWEALMRIPPGLLVSYEEIAKFIGKPGSTRAVSNAIARNPLPVIIPCHRVIRKMGLFGGYRFGTTRKKAIHGWEFAQNLA